MHLKEFEINNFENKIYLKNKFIDNAWKDKSKVWGEVLHKTCPYNAMFPVRLANFFIKKFSNEGDIILDPFSGRGTTLLEGRILNRKTFASDLNPLSYVLSKSKEKNLELDIVLDRINELEKIYKKQRNKRRLLFKINNLEIMQIYYSDLNLMQISFLREQLGRKWKYNTEIDNFILSICLGLMHGPSKKDGSSSFFSLSMSNSFSMSPNYVRRYSFEKKLVKPESNIFELIANKINIVYSRRGNALKESKYDSQFKMSNVLEISKTWKDLDPKLIFTSPPYLNIINYTKQNWIKMWMLGFETNLENKNIGLDDFHTEKTYLDNFLIKFMQECYAIMNYDSKLIMVVGDVIKKGICYSIKDQKNYLEEQTGLKLVEIYTDQISQTKKTTNSMGTKAGKATQVERIYVFVKENTKSDEL